jgi:hypothetical protein
MKRLGLSFLSSFALFSMLASGLTACSSDPTPAPTPPGGSSAGATGVGGKSGTGGSAPSSGGSPNGGSGNAGSATGGSPSGGTGPAAGGSATGGSGTAGSAGSAPQAGAGGAAGGPVGGGGAPANAILSADFESDEAGKQPAGWHNFIAYNIDAMNPQSGLQAIVDATKPHGGKNSLHVKSNGGPAFLTMPLPANLNKLYVRGYFYMTRQLGQNPGANHETLFGIRKDKDTEIRFGEIKGVLGVNEVPSDNITPKMDQWGKGPLIPANKWVCIEGAFIGDKAQHEVHGWADGTEVITVTSGDQWQNGVEPATFLNGYWKEFMIGWQSFSSASNELWIDDLVLSPTRVNCQ